MKSQINRMLLVATAVVIMLFLWKGDPEFVIRNVPLDRISNHALNMTKSHTTFAMDYQALFRKTSAQETWMDNKAILTLFTTFKESRIKSYIHRNTIRNWGLLSPDVLPVLFIDLKAPSAIVDYTRKSKWHILPVPRMSESGIPILCHMFLEVQRLFNTTFYAYANSDILFDRNLTDTIHELIRLKKNLTNILIVGQRRNWKINWKQNVWNLQEIGHYAKSAKLLSTYAQDYFISTRNGYPWSTIPDFVVGRIAYDSWLVVTALKRGIPLVDASGTITALHQTDSRWDREGSKAVVEGRLNVYLAGINFPYHAAHTTCAHFSTGRYNGVFVIKESKYNGNRCNSVAIPYVKSPFHLS